MYIDIDRAIEALKGCTDETDRQIAAWLEELKEIKENQHKSLRYMYEKGYNKAIDDFAEKFIFKAVCEGCSGCCNCYENDGRYECEDYKAYMKIKEQLKAGVSSGTDNQ